MLRSLLSEVVSEYDQRGLRAWEGSQRRKERDLSSLVFMSVALKHPFLGAKHDAPLALDTRKQSNSVAR